MVNFLNFDCLIASWKIATNIPNFGTKNTKITETVPNFGQKLQKSQKRYQTLVQKLQKSRKQYKTLVKVLFVYLLSQCRQCSTESADCSPQFSKQQRKRSCLFTNMWFLILNWHYYMWYLLNSTTQKLLKSYRFPFLRFLFRYFKEEAKFYFKDHQCIQALPLGLKMSMVPTQYNLERKQHKYWKKTMKIRFVKHVGIQDSDLHLFRFNRLCAFFFGRQDSLD